MCFTTSIDYDKKSRKEGVYIDHSSSSLSWGGWNCSLGQRPFRSIISWPLTQACNTYYEDLIRLLQTHDSNPRRGDWRAGRGHRRPWGILTWVDARPVRDQESVQSGPCSCRQRLSCQSGQGPQRGSPFWRRPAGGSCSQHETPADLAARGVLLVEQVVVEITRGECRCRIGWRVDGMTTRIVSSFTARPRHQPQRKRAKTCTS